AVGEGEAERIDAKVGNAPDAVGFLTDLSEPVVNLVPVRPGFHEPRTDARPRAHADLAPADAPRGVGLGVAPRHFAGGLMPSLQQGAAVQLTEPARRILGHR